MSCASGKYCRRQLFRVVDHWHHSGDLRGEDQAYAEATALWRGWGLGLSSGALLAFGLVSFLFIHNSPRPVVEGNLWDIREIEEHSTRFMITDAAGHAVLIRCGYSGPGFVEGERARVRYVEYNRKLVEMDMLTGSYQQWHLRESSGEQGCWGWVAIGAVCGFFAYRQLAKIRQGQTTAL
jgi:hypothetical protein